MKTKPSKKLRKWSKQKNGQVITNPFLPWVSSETNIDTVTTKKI